MALNQGEVAIGKSVATAFVWSGSLACRYFPVDHNLWQGLRRDLALAVNSRPRLKTAVYLHSLTVFSELCLGDGS